MPRPSSRKPGKKTSAPQSRKPREALRAGGVAVRSDPLNTVNATQAKNRFGDIMKRVSQSEAVFIEKHGSPQAVVLDIESYRALVKKAREPQQVQLDALRAEFDAMYARMQTPKFRKIAEDLSSMSADELNRISARRMKSRG